MDVATIWEEPDLQLITHAAEYFFLQILGSWWVKLHSEEKEKEDSLFIIGLKFSLKRHPSHKSVRTGIQAEISVRILSPFSSYKINISLKALQFKSTCAVFKVELNVVEVVQKS